MTVRNGSERLELRRRTAAREWSSLTGAIRAETGCECRSPAWWATLAGLALGFELARRWLRDPISPGRRRIDA